MLCMYIYTFPQLSQYSEFIGTVYKTLDSTNKYYIGNFSLEFNLKIGVIHPERVSLWKYKSYK